MLYKRDRYYSVRFKWNRILIRESTRNRDLPTAKKISKNETLKAGA